MSAKTSAKRGGLFVVQKHHATRLHYDFRLELGGVLVSWAIPKTPPMDPAKKCLAVRVENHPLEYGAFEGVIPEGNYGAGPVILWDRGAWIPENDPEEGLKSGEIKFTLKGYKLRGRFTLVNTARPRARGEHNEWLLIKKNDELADPDRELSEESILSGLTIEEMREGSRRAARVRAALDELGAPRHALVPEKLSPMLAQPRDDAFSDPAWIFELKYDGYRALAAKRGDGQAYLKYRSGQECTERYPEIAGAIAALPYDSFVIDGELVVFDEHGRPVFNLMQQRGQLSRTSDIARAAAILPATLVCFDLLAFEGYDLLDLPLLARKEILRDILPAAGPLRYCDHIEEHGEAFWTEIAAHDLEGMVCKKADSVYRPGIRSEAWQKVRKEREDDFAIVGYTEPKGSRAGFGGLDLAVWTDEGWRYAGRVGGGFSETELAAMRERLDALPRWKPPFEVPQMSRHTWVEPRLVCTVRYREWTEGHSIRFPIFVRLREDKAPRECTAPGDGAGVEEPESAPAIARTEPEKELRFSNLDKVFWPEDGYTKGDLIDYYRAIWPHLAPYLRDRPVVLTRFPDGIHGKSFFQKDAPRWVPAWIRTEVMWSEHAEREIAYFLCDDEDSLAYLANLGTIPLHVWSSRVASIQTPDWCILDLDPKGAPMTDVVTCAKAIRKLCREILLPTYVKTSGSSGLHVLIPLGGQCTYEQSRTLAHLLARVIEERHGDVATTTRTIEARGGKVYLDWGQNGHGRLLVAPYSVRPIAGAPVSMPLRWSEVNRKLDISRFTIANAAARMKRLSSDPLVPVLGETPDLVGALERLSEIVAEQ